MTAVPAICWLFALALGLSGDTSADAVLGQADFVTAAANAPSGSVNPIGLSLGSAPHVALAPDGRLYVADSNNNRVLRWPSAGSFGSGDPADLVLGQPDFVSSAPNNGGVSASSMSLPQGLWVDASNNLWVTDAFNSRVLKFNNPATDATPTAADLVVGQADFTGNQQNLGNGEHGTAVALPDGLQFPGRVLVRGTHLWIADSGNSRVLHYANPVANKPFADRVFGQYGDFTRRAKNNDGVGENGCCPTADNLFNPIGIALDPQGNLYVADYVNMRVVRFNDPLTTDTTADAVLGQPDFLSNTPNNGGIAAGFLVPIDVAFDSLTRLFVVDSGNNRILAFDSPATASLPSRVFGQLDDFTIGSPNHGSATPDVDGLSGPTGVALDATGNVYIVDTNNNRTLRYDLPFRMPGDLNCDNHVNVSDINAFIVALLDAGQYAVEYPGCDRIQADVNGDATIDGRDVDAFADLLLP